MRYLSAVGPSALNLDTPHHLNIFCVCHSKNVFSGSRDRIGGLSFPMTINLNTVVRAEGSYIEDQATWVVISLYAVFGSLKKSRRFSILGREYLGPTSDQWFSLPYP
jgi:hypothetical protein